MEFDGKVVIVTGSTSGIGEQIAFDFAKNGAKVVVNGRDTTRLNAVVEKCNEVSPTKQKALGVIADLRVDEDIKKLVDTTIATFGKLDVLVNNAGVVSFHSVEDPNIVSAFDKAIRNNVRPIVVLSNLAIPQLINSKGCIVNISSLGAKKPIPMMLTLSSGDAAKDLITRTMALELGPKGVRVNSVRPGYIKTPAYAEHGLVFEEFEALKRQPLEKHGAPADVSNCVLFLASKKAEFITGAHLSVDGGITDV